MLPRLPRSCDDNYRFHIRSLCAIVRRRSGARHDRSCATRGVEMRRRSATSLPLRNITHLLAWRDGCRGLQGHRSCSPLHGYEKGTSPCPDVLTEEVYPRRCLPEDRRTEAPRRFSRRLRGRKDHLPPSLFGAVFARSHVINHLSARESLVSSLSLRAGYDLILLPRSRASCYIKYGLLYTP